MHREFFFLINLPTQSRIKGAGKARKNAPSSPAGFAPLREENSFGCTALTELRV
jgi:hypothetical protein